MTIFLYDKSFEGLLTVIFEAYRLKTTPQKISAEPGQMNLFGSEIVQIETEKPKATRVWNGLQKKLSPQGSKRIFRVFCSELPDIEMLIFRFAQRVFASRQNIEGNYADDCVLQVRNIHRKVAQEAMRMVSFVRFQQTADGVFYSGLSPKYNVLPLIAPYFKDRYADQKWILYDLKRDCGLFYDLHDLQEVQLRGKEVDRRSGEVSWRVLSDDERLYQELWHTFYDATTIKERRNTKLHLHFMPYRYWKYLPEKRHSVRR